MSKHHHHNGAPVSTSCRRRSHLHQTPSRSVPEVGIIPGNRFFLLPLKKVTALVRPHTPCRESSATKTKPCIVSKAKQASSPGAEVHRERLLQEFYVRSQAQLKSTRLITKQRRRRSVIVAKTRLSPVCELACGVAEQELLLEYERLLLNDGRLVDTRNCRNVGVSRAKNTSIFTWGETTLLESYRGASLAASSTQMLQELNRTTATKTKEKKRSNSFSNASDMDLVLYRSSRRTHTKSRLSISTSTESLECMISGGRSFGRNNRVSPSSLSHGQQLHLEFGMGNDCATSFGKADDLDTPRNKKRSNSRATSFGKADDLDTPRNKNRSNSRATSFGKADDLDTPRNKIRSNSRATSFGKADELVTPRNQNRSKSRATSFGKADELVTPRNQNRSKSRATSFSKADGLVTPRNRKFRGNITTSTKADELVPELETPWNKDGSNFSDNCTTSFSKADELETLCDKNSLSNFRSNSTTSFDRGDEIVKLCDKNRKKSRSHRRTSSGKADEILIRDKKRRNFSFWGCSHQIRSCSPFLCSFTNKNDLPVSPSPMQLSRRLQNNASVAEGEG